MSTTDPVFAPDYAPMPRSALGPALNARGYHGVMQSIRLDLGQGSQVHS